MKFIIATLLLLSPSFCSTQQYTVLDLGNLGDVGNLYPNLHVFADAINSSGQVAGYADILGLENTSYFLAEEHAFRTEADSPINAATDDLGTLGGKIIIGLGINDSGQVVGWSTITGGAYHAFRTAANRSINPVTDDLGTIGGANSVAWGINDSGQVVGGSTINDNSDYHHAFRTAANSPINPATDDLGTLGGLGSEAFAINAKGQVAGGAYLPAGPNGEFIYHAFRTAANRSIDLATDDLGTLGGLTSGARGINDSGQVVGESDINSSAYHAFRTAANSPINPATDDLGTLGGSLSFALGINDSGQVVGYATTTAGDFRAFLYSGGVMYDLNNLIPAGFSGILLGATAINDAGQIVAYGRDDKYGYTQQKIYLLTPNSPYKAAVQPPISADGRSIFTASRGVIPVKFTLTKNDSLTCDLPMATISVTRIAGNDIGSIGNGVYRMPANTSAAFRISDCQYVYNLAARSLGAGVYRVSIVIGANVVGSTEFELE